MGPEDWGGGGGKVGGVILLVGKSGDECEGGAWMCWDGKDGVAGKVGEVILHG